MPSYLRALVRTVVAAALVASMAVAAVAPSALAASSNAAGTGSFSLDDEWCFQDVVDRYCFVMDGTAHWVDRGDVSRVTINLRQQTVVTRDGVVIGESRTVTLDQAVFEGALVTVQSVVHTRAEFGGQTCQVTAVLRVDDYEIVVDHWLAPDCH